MNTSNRAVAQLQFESYQQNLSKSIKALDAEDNYYMSFSVEPHRFIPPYQYHIPGVQEQWKTRYMMRSQRAENLILKIAQWRPS